MTSVNNHVQIRWCSKAPSKHEFLEDTLQPMYLNLSNRSLLWFPCVWVQGVSSVSTHVLGYYWTQDEAWSFIPRPPSLKNLELFLWLHFLLVSSWLSKKCSYSVSRSLFSETWKLPPLVFKAGKASFPILAIKFTPLFWQWVGLYLTFSSTIPKLWI